nr:immunoglobulin light chain junction region [Homo sapiens]MBZ83386.1 immunoglobulin light chain junction region [Homo sapiens]MBZ98467.1 immunoglobulin light chain junction region [Homo sapiens]MCB80715.1 immunoglobulin light chain junction region [Homo sapiens]MCD24795.1 immunoglobulin light chain junction region [Homo sapiens]
CCSYAGSSTF